MKAAFLLLATGCTLGVLPSASAGGGLGPVAAMSVARAAHAAASLPSGDVLVTGGCTAPGCEAATASTEIYRAAQRRFVEAPAMSAARVGHAAVALKDGTVLVVGGWAPSRPASSAELFLPRGNRFVPTGRLRTPRGGFSATRLRDGRVLVVGGTDGSSTLASAEVYDPLTRVFRAAGRLRSPREAHSASLLRDGRVLVVGGSNKRGVLASAEIWDPRTQTFRPAGRMSVPRHKHAAVTLHDGRVLVVGGSDERDFRGRYATAELYAGSRFTPAGRMAEARFKLPHAVVLLRSRDVLVAGGGAYVERYTATTNSFSGRLPLAGARAFSTATRLPGGFVLIAGGYDDSIRPTAQAWFYGLP